MTGSQKYTIPRWCHRDHRLPPIIGDRDALHYYQRMILISIAAINHATRGYSEKVMRNPGFFYTHYYRKLINNYN